MKKFLKIAIIVGVALTCLAIGTGEEKTEPDESAAD